MPPAAADFRCCFDYAVSRAVMLTMLRHAIAAMPLTLPLCYALLRHAPEYAAVTMLAAVFCY